MPQTAQTLLCVTGRTCGNGLPLGRPTGRMLLLDSDARETRDDGHDLSVPWNEGARGRRAGRG